LDLAEKIKKHWPNVKIVFITGYETSDIVKRAMEPKTPNLERLGLDFITKTDADKIIQAIRDAFPD